VIKAGRTARRYAVIRVSDERRGDRPYFNKIDLLMLNGGHAALLDYLLNIDLSKMPDPAVIPKTRELQLQKAQSLEPFEQWWLNLITHGIQGKWPREIETKTLQEMYNSGRGKFDAVNPTSFGMKLGKVTGGIVRNERRGKEADTARIYKMPTHSAVKQAWEHIYGIDVDSELEDTDINESDDF